MFELVRWLRLKEVTIVLVLGALLAASMSANLTGYLWATDPDREGVIDYARAAEATCKAVDEALFEKENASGGTDAVARNKKKQDNYSFCLSIQSTKAARDQAEYARGQYRVGIASAVISSLALAAAIAAACFAAGAVNQGRRAANEARRQANAALTAVEHARVSAEAAVRSANIADRTAERDQQARVEIMGARLVTYFNEPADDDFGFTGISDETAAAFGLRTEDSIAVEISFRNRGKLPAHDGIATVDIGVFRETSILPPTEVAAAGYDLPISFLAANDTGNPDKLLWLFDDLPKAVKAKFPAIRPHDLQVNVVVSITYDDDFTTERDSGERRRTPIYQFVSTLVTGNMTRNLSVR